jgi:hypothetical protein
LQGIYIKAGFTRSNGRHVDLNKAARKNAANADYKNNKTMAQKKPFALRIDAELLEAVEKWAADEFRSTNGQLEWIISKAVKDAKRLKVNKTPEQEQQRGEG